MKKIHFISAFMALLFFSLTIPQLLQFFHSHIEDYETIAIKPKKSVEFQSINEVYTIKSMDKDNWVYFSFSKGSTLEIKDEMSLNWDIAFRRTNFKSNGGANNKKGKTALINLGSVEFNSIERAPDNGYVADTKWIGTIRNDQLNKWYKYSTQFHTVTSKKDAYIIRTADGKYAKMKILYYYCQGGESACITIEYFYQPDGTKNLKNPNTIVKIVTN